MKYCLDRIEGDSAVCLVDNGEEETQVCFSLALNPALKEVGEGNLFEATADGEGHLTAVVPLTEESEARRVAARARLERLFAGRKRGK